MNIAGRLSAIGRFRTGRRGFALQPMSLGQVVLVESRHAWQAQRSLSTPASKMVTTRSTKFDSGHPRVEPTSSYARFALPAMTTIGRKLPMGERQPTSAFGELLLQSCQSAGPIQAIHLLSASAFLPRQPTGRCPLTMPAAGEHGGQCHEPCTPPVLWRDTAMTRG